LHGLKAGSHFQRLKSKTVLTLEKPKAMTVEVPPVGGCVKWSHIFESSDSDSNQDSPCLDPPQDLASQPTNGIVVS
ncbi:hypothetical protein KI387_010136, partial [Taxus chinensis]